jgi:ubiquinone/menaquinone biosynthesis C-methylase UbiE
MNRFESWFCGSAYWRYLTQRQLMPWLVAGSELGEHVLELGAGPGAATEELQRRAGRVTSLEYDHGFATRLAGRVSSTDGSVIQGDAAALPFSDSTFSSAIAILMLHHLRSNELQDRALAEICRVLQPGGVFLAFEIEDGWLNRVGHIRSTFVPIDPATVHARAKAAGFSRATADPWRSGFRIRALR